MNIIPCSAPTLAVALYQLDENVMEVLLQPVVGYEVEANEDSYRYTASPICDSLAYNFIGIVYTICNGYIYTEDPDFENTVASYFDRDAEHGQTDTIKELVRNKFPELEFI